MTRLTSLLLFFLAINLCAISSCSDDSDPIDNPTVEQPTTNNQEFNPEAFGYSLDKLEGAKEWADSNTETAAVVVMVDGEILYEWGNTKKKHISHSVRKSFMSALYGKYAMNGIININTTLEELGIDDIPPLTDQEKTATIKHCLQSASGVYHTAEAESDYMHELKPDRNEHLPGTFWIYNNWDFNVLRTIFEQETGENFYTALKRDIMDPLGASFVENDSIFWTPERSIHPAYMFFISATDMAKFGQLMLQEGTWEGRQIIPRSWVKLSTKYQWDAEIYNGDGYGYMWWVATNENAVEYLPNCDLPANTYSARGTGGQWLEVIPEYNMVFVHMTDTRGGDFVETEDVGTILQLILDAKI